MPDSYGVCFTTVGRGRRVRWERPSIMTAFITTKPSSNSTGKYVRDMVSEKLREKFHKSRRRKTIRAAEAEQAQRKRQVPASRLQEKGKPRTSSRHVAIFCRD